MLVNLVNDFYSANYFTWDDHRTVPFGGLWKVSDHILTFRQQHPEFDHDKAIIIEKAELCGFKFVGFI
jgi:hypothetical protein